MLSFFFFLSVFADTARLGFRRGESASGSSSSRAIAMWSREMWPNGDAGICR